MHPDKYPSEQAMLVLMGVWLGSTVVVDGDELRLDVAGRSRRATVPITPADLDTLEERGWVEVLPGADGQLRATDTGVYHAKAWASRKLGKGKVRSVKSLTPMQPLSLT